METKWAKIDRKNLEKALEISKTEMEDGRL